MARVDILLSIVKSAIGNDNLSLRKAVEALAADERLKNHCGYSRKALEQC